MLIKVQTLTGNTFDIENVKPTDTIRSIKETVERIEGISVDQQDFVTYGLDQQKFVYYVRVLADCQIVEECCLSDGSVIHLTPPCRCGDGRESCNYIIP